MIKIEKVRLLFEQSGTFKKQFKLLGFDAYDYDIENQFEQTDFVIDLFKEIENAYNGVKSMFDDFGKDDLIVAFFPCTYFSTQNNLIWHKKIYQFKFWDDEKIDNYVENRKKDRDLFYSILLKFIDVIEKRGFKTIIENPYTSNYLLYQKEMKQPDLVIQDRTLYGDYYKKPTMFYYFNFEPSFMSEYTLVTKNKEKKQINFQSGINRSLIHPDFAFNFIQKYILGIR